MKLSHFTLTAALVAASPVQFGKNPVVDLGYVKYGGVVDPSLNVTSWNGIYYASSPEGALRWQPPVEIEKSNNYSSSQVINATKLGPSCLQGIAPWFTDNLPRSGLPQSENCLLLNVHKPSSPVSSKLPVMVQIHGGGYTVGDTTTAAGSDLVSRSRGSVIYVEIQYRLGGLGFLSGSEIRRNGTANAGLLDQRAALNWVQRHIQAFGGDPAKVAIIGGSAGGGSVTAQMQLFGGAPKPPFRAAVAEFAWWQPFHDDKVLEAQYENVLKATGCSNLGCLRKLPFNSLAKGINQSYVVGYASGGYGQPDFYYGPSVDGNIIKELPSVAFPSGRFSKVPLWTDHDALEGLVFTNTSITSEKEIISNLKRLWPNGNQTFFSQLEKLYPVTDFNGSYFQTPVLAASAPNTAVGQAIEATAPGVGKNFGKNPYFYKLQQIYGDSFVSCGTRTTAKALTNYGVPVWKTVYNTGDLVHGAIDSALLLPPNQLFGNADDLKDLEAYLLSFVTDLDPNKAAAFKDIQRPYWPTYGVNTTTLDFNETSIGIATDAEASQRCDFFFVNGAVIRN